MTPFDPTLLITLLEKGDIKAADEMDRLADVLKTAAQQMRDAYASAQQDGGFVSTSGFGDRIKINVVGPNGSIKQSIDTGA